MIDIRESQSGWYETVVNDHVVLMSSDKGICERIARILEHCRNIPYRVAIKTIMEDIGYGEENAKHLYEKLFSHNQPTSLQ